MTPCAWCQIRADTDIARAMGDTRVPAAVGYFRKRTRTGETVMALCADHAKAPSVLGPA